MRATPTAPEEYICSFWKRVKGIPVMKGVEDATSPSLAQQTKLIATEGRHKPTHTLFDCGIVLKERTKPSGALSEKNIMEFMSLRTQGCPSCDHRAWVGVAAPLAEQLCWRLGGSGGVPRVSPVWNFVQESWCFSVHRALAMPPSHLYWGSAGYLRSKKDAILGGECRH